MSTRCAFVSIKPGVMNLPGTSIVFASDGIATDARGPTDLIFPFSISTTASGIGASPVAVITVPPTNASCPELGSAARVSPHTIADKKRIASAIFRKILPNRNFRANKERRRFMCHHLRP